MYYSPDPPLTFRKVPVSKGNSTIEQFSIDHLKVWGLSPSLLFIFLPKLSGPQLVSLSLGLQWQKATSVHRKSVTFQLCMI